MIRTDGLALRVRLAPIPSDKPMNTRGSIENSAILGMGVVTVLTYSTLVGAGISREQIRIEALVAEAHRIKEAVQNWQADNADPVTGYTNAEEVGWPDAFGPDGFLNDPVGPPPTPSTDDCLRALAALAGDVDFDGVRVFVPQQEH